MNKKYAIGIDIGGSHISAMLIDMEQKKPVDGTLVEQKINNKASSEEIISRWSLAIQQVLEHVNTDELAGVGIAMPGPFEYATGISRIKGVDKYESLYGINVGQAIRETLNLQADISFRYVNDATAFAIGESWIGKASAHQQVVAITLGTGFGSSFIRQGVPVIEGDDIPTMGYVYDIPYADSIADDHFATRWFVREWKARTGEECKGVKEIAEKVPTDNRAKVLFDDFGKALGNFMAPYLKSFGAQCLVIGGNISGAFGLFEAEMRKALSAKSINIDIYVSSLGELSAMAGAARLLDEYFWSEMKNLISKY